MVRGSDDDDAETTATGSAEPSELVTLMATDGGVPRPTDPADDVALGAGATVGRYVVLQELARGGMGVVYAAYDPELDRRVALKLLRSRARRGSDAARARLLREAQALARVSHPNVIIVHDVGTHEGDVFVAMELVDGGTLDQWRKGAHGWRETLELLCLAGAGLQGAHDQGVVHRDFKPHNILIGKDGRVRVADFGLARAAELPTMMGDTVLPEVPREAITASPLLERSVHLTQTGAILGTPAYMAPEQHRGRVGDVRSDIFSFCVTCWEALYGRRPYSGETAAALVASVLAGKIEEPPADSHVPARVQHALRRGLAVEPDLRPRSVNEVLDGLQGALGRPRWHYAVAAGLLGVTAGLGYVLGTSREEPCAIGNERFAGVWDDAQRQGLASAFAATGRPFAAELSVRTEAAIDRFTAGWIEGARSVCEATRVHHRQSEALLDLRMACLDRRARDLAIALRSLQDGDAELLAHSLDIVRGLPSVDACVDLDAGRDGDAPLDEAAQAKADELREQLSRARTLRDGGTYARALELAEPAAEAARELGHAPVTAEALLLLADLHRHSDAPERARIELEDAMRLAIEAGDDRLAAEISVASIYTVGHALDDLAGAEGWDRQAQGWLSRIGHPERLEAQRLDARAVVYLFADRPDAALADLTRVQELQARALEPDDPSRATVASHLGDVMYAKGQYDEAVDHYRQALAIFEAAYGPAHPQLSAPLNNLGVNLQDLGRFDEAREVFVRARELSAAAQGPRSSGVALALFNESTIDRDEGKLAEAIAKGREALEIFEQVRGDKDAHTIGALTTLATSLAMAQQFPEATELFRRAWAADIAAHGPDSLKAAYSENNLGTVLAEQGRVDEGLPHLHSALAAKERLLGPTHPNLGSTLDAIGSALLTQAKPREALPYFERAYAVQHEALGEDHPAVAQELYGQGRARLELGQAAEAVPLLERALQIREAATVPPVDLGRARFALAQARFRTGDPERARELATAALAALEGAEHTGEDRARVQAWLADPR